MSQDTPTTPATTFTAEQLEAESAWYAHEAARMWSNANSETAIVYERTSAMLEFAASLVRREEQQGWQPIATLPDEYRSEHRVVLRPHIIWGAMDVRYQPRTHQVTGQELPWLNGDYTTGWPEEAFMPFWMPLPAKPTDLRAELDVSR